MTERAAAPAAGRSNRPRRTYCIARTRLHEIVILVSVACNGAHSLKQRLPRWLLMMRDRSDDDTLVITQSLLAEMLGVHRPTITNAIRKLERAEHYRQRYSDFTVKHFHEQLVKRHDYKLCYTVTKASLHAAGLVAKAKRRGAHRKKRERRPLPGMLLFQDGSAHRWIAGLGRDLDLVVTLDDATSAIRSALLVERRPSTSRRRSRSAGGQSIGGLGILILATATN
jgi:DNA-binding MarR family transcriptional regulator